MHLIKGFYCLLFMFILPVSTKAQIPDADSAAYHLLVRHINAWSMHNAEAVNDIFNEDGIYEDVAYDVKNHGIEEIKTFLRETFKEIPDFRVELISWFSCGYRLSCEWVMSGTLSEDSADQETAGKSFSVRGTSVARIKDGKFERWTDYYDK